MEHALPARSPRNKKKKNPGPYKKTQALIHKKKKKKKKTDKKGKKKKKTLKPKPFSPDQDSDSLYVAILHCNSIYTQISLACSNPSNRRTKKSFRTSKKPCSSSAIVKTEHFPSFSATTEV